VKSPMSASPKISNIPPRMLNRISRISSIAATHGRSLEHSGLLLIQPAFLPHDCEGHRVSHPFDFSLMRESAKLGAAA
jgi:hypothetical protein